MNGANDLPVRDASNDMQLKVEAAAVWLESLRVEYGLGAGDVFTIDDFGGETIADHVCDLVSRAEEAKVFCGPVDLPELDVIAYATDLASLIVAVRPRFSAGRMVDGGIWTYAQVASYTVDVEDLGVSTRAATDLIEVLRCVAHEVSALLPAVRAVLAGQPSRGVGAGGSSEATTGEVMT